MDYKVSRELCCNETDYKVGGGNEKMLTEIIAPGRINEVTIPFLRDLIQFTILFTANMDANNEVHHGVMSYGLDDEGIRVHFNTQTNELVVKVMETSTTCKANQVSGRHSKHHIIIRDKKT